MENQLENDRLSSDEILNDASQKFGNRVENNNLIGEKSIKCFKEFEKKI